MLGIDNSKRYPKETEPKGKEAKSKSKAKKSKKHKRAAEDTGLQGVIETDFTANTPVADYLAEAVNNVNSHDESGGVLGGLTRPAKKANGKTSRRKRAEKLAEDGRNEDNVQFGNRIEPTQTTSAGYVNDIAESEVLTRLPQKLKKAKRAKSRNLASDSFTNYHEDANGLEKLLHRPLTPTNKSYYPIEADGDRGDNQQQHSEKALGKRKAVDEPGKQGHRKKARKSTSNEAQGQDLRQIFPVQQSSRNSPQVRVVMENVNPNTKKHNIPTVDSPSEDHIRDKSDVSGSQVSPTLHEKETGLPFEAAVLQASEIRKHRKRRLSVDRDDSGHVSKSKKISRLELNASSKNPSKTPQSTVKATGTAAASSLKSSLTVADTTAISQAVEAYREDKNMTQRQVNGIIQLPANSVASKALWTSIYEELPYIPRRNIQQFCRRNFHNYEGRGVWTVEQDEELREAYQRRPNKWTDIGQELNRFPEDVRDRWRNYLVCAGNMKKDVWDRVEEEQLLAAVAECVHDIREGRHRTGSTPAALGDEERLIDWQKVSEKMHHTRSRLQCSYKWKRLNAANKSDNEGDERNPIISRSWRLRDAKVQARTMSTTEKLRLLQAIRDSGASREGKIPWRNIALELKETGKRMTWKVCIRRLMNRLPGSEGMSFGETIERLVDVFEASAPNEPEGLELNPLMPSYTRGLSSSQTMAVNNEPDPLATDSDEEEQVIKAMSAKKGRKSMRTSNTKSKGNETSNAGDGERQPSTPKEKRKFRDRMRRQDESTPEPADPNSGSFEEAITTDAEEDMIPNLQLPKADKKKRRKSKARKILSEEIVVEELSSDEHVTTSQPGTQPVDEKDDESCEVESSSREGSAVKVEAHDKQSHDRESVDLDGESPPSGNDLGNHEFSDIEEDEYLLERANETGSVDLEDHAIATNGFDDEESEVNTDDALSTRSSDNADVDASESVNRDDDNKKFYRRIASQHVEKYFDNAASDSESVSSSGSSISSIPAKVNRKRDMSIEL